MEPDIHVFWRRQRQKILSPPFLVFSFFLVLPPIKKGACPAESSLYLDFFMLLTLYTAWGQANSIFSASASHSPVKCSHMALGAAEGGFLPPGSPLLPARIPREC